MFKTKCKSVIYTTLQEGTVIRSLYSHNHKSNADKWDAKKMIAKRFKIVHYKTRPSKKLSKESVVKKKGDQVREIAIHVEGHAEPIKLKVLDDTVVNN